MPNSVITMLIQVRADGSVGAVVIKASGGTSLIDAAAEAYVRKIHWKAGTLNGKPVETTILYSLPLPS